MPIDLSTLLPICEHCMLRKQTKTLVPKLREGVREKVKLEKIFSDITSLEVVATKNSDKYMLNMIDDCTGYTWVYMLKQKSDAAQTLKEWKAMVENEAGHCIGILQSDGGSEYNAMQFETYLHEQGVRHEVTAPHSSFQN